MGSGHVPGVVQYILRVHAQANSKNHGGGHVPRVCLIMPDYYRSNLRANADLPLPNTF